MRLALAAVLLAASAAAKLPSASVEAAEAAVKADDTKRARKLIAEAEKVEQTTEDRERIALLYQALKDFPVAENRLRALIKESPKEPRLRLFLACVIAMGGDRAGALKTLAEGERLAPTAQDRQRMAFLHQDLKDYPPARELLDGLIKENPKDLSVRIDRASLAAQSGEPKRLALAQLDAAAALSPGPDDKRRMAAIYRDLKEFGKAKALLGGVPEDAAALYDRAVLAAHAGDRGAALSALAAAEKLAPPLDLRRKIAARYLDLRAFDEGFACVSALIRDFPAHPSIRLDLAELSYRRAAREEALDALRTALDRHPDLQDRQRASLLYQNLGELKPARAILTGLLKEEPNDPQLHINSAYLAADEGDKARAEAELAEALRLNADPDDRKRIALLRDRLAGKSKSR